MKAFISWSGSRELLIAKAVKAWLNAVVPEVRAFVSPDLPKGLAWFDTLAKELKDAGIGFMCLAPPRVASEWQLVEAGAIWKAARSGGLFPLCFRIRGADVPEPLRAFQLTYFDKADFQRLARDVATRARPDRGWTPKRDQAFESSWPTLRASVEDALDQPDNGVHTTRGFIHEIVGGWWERVRSEKGATKLSWMWFEPSVDGAGLTIEGRGFGAGGLDASRWQTDLVSIQAQLPQPILEYYWEGRHPRRPGLLFGGKCRLQFTVSASGRIDEGTGQFSDVCLNAARRPTIKLIDLRRATTEEISIMKEKGETERRALAGRKLEAWA